MKSNLYCDYGFLIDLAPNEIPLADKSTRKVYAPYKFGSIYNIKKYMSLRVQRIELRNSVRNLIKSNQSQIISSIFRLI